MKKICFFPLVLFAGIFLLTNGCSPDGGPDDEPANAMAISSLNKMAAMPASQILITGTGFGDGTDLWVRFSDLNGYVMDVPAIQSDATRVLVTVPPYINISDGDWKAGTVAVQVIKKSDSKESTSTRFENFSILEMPVAETVKPGLVTLMFMEGQINYFRQVKQEMAGTELATPQMLASVTSSIINLENLYSNLEKIVNSPIGQSKDFNYGSINGQEINIGTKQLEQSDRYILALFAALSDPDLSNPFEPLKSIQDNPCSVEAAEAQLQMGSGQNNSGTYNSMACMATSLPNAINTVGNVIFGAGAVGIGVVTLVAIGFEVPVAVTVALPTAAIIYATMGTAGLEVVTGAVLQNIDNNAAVQAIHSGVDRIEDMFQGMIVDFVIPEAIGAFNNLIQGNNSLGEAFGNSNTGADCTYALSAGSFQALATGGNGSVTVTTQPGCTWTAVSGYSWILVSSGGEGSGSGSVEYTVQPNPANQQRTGSIQIADRSFTVVQEPNTQAGPYDGLYTFVMVGTCYNQNMIPSSWPYPGLTSEIGIQGHNILGFDEHGIGVLNDEGYAAWSAYYYRFSGTFYSSGTGVGSWEYGPDGGGTTASGTWNATKH